MGRAASPRRATKLALRDGPDVVAAAPKRPISVTPIGREALFGSARARACPASNLVGNSLDTPTCAGRNAFVVAFGRHEARLTGRQGAADGRDVREAAVPHARGGGHRCARAPGRARATPTVDPRRRPLQRPASFIPSRPASRSLQKMAFCFSLPLRLFGAFPRGARAAPTGARPDGRPETDPTSASFPLRFFSRDWQVPSTCL